MGNQFYRRGWKVWNQEILQNLEHQLWELNACIKSHTTAQFFFPDISSYRSFSTESEAGSASFERKGGRNIESNARNRVAEKNDEAIPTMQKKILFVLDIASIIIIALLAQDKTL